MQFIHTNTVKNITPHPLQKQGMIKKKKRSNEIKGQFYKKKRLNQIHLSHSWVSLRSTGGLFQVIKGTFSCIFHIYIKAIKARWSSPLGQSLKVAIIGIYISNECKNNVKGVTSSDGHAQNYHSNLQLPSALQSFIASFSSLFTCPAHNFTVLVHSHRSQSLFLGSCFQRKKNSIKATDRQS